MCCLRGRYPCPCWPQAEPFDKAEMDLLTAMRSYVNSFGYDLPWTSIQRGCVAVARHRRAYVMSTLLGSHHHATCDVTLLGWVRYDYGKTQWLLNHGVCPNISWARRHLEVRGWIEGPLHPGRPLQNLLCPIVNLTPEMATKKLLLLAGAYPRADAAIAPALRRQWHAWHGRASRCVWARVLLDTPLPKPL